MGTGLGILKGPAAAGGKAQAPGSFQKNIRGRFALADHRIIAKNPHLNRLEPGVGAGFKGDRGLATAGGQGHGYLEALNASH